MKCLIFSDSHGKASNMCEVLSKNRDAEVVFFLGDGIADLLTVREAEINSGVYRTYLPVRGNSDLGFLSSSHGVGKTEEIVLQGKKIVYTHGDLYDAKYGMSGLNALIKDRCADILLFGHTHTPYEAYENGVYIFNPGSIREGSFGILTLKEGSVLFSHGAKI